MADTLELYFLLMPEYWRQGYGFEISTKLIELAFSSLLNACIVAYIKPENHAALGLIKKLHFSQKSMVTYNNAPHLLYGLDRPTD